MKTSLYALLAFLLFASSALTVGAEIIRGYNTSSSSKLMPVTLQIDSIDFRSDLARVYGHIYGTPHTSFRIDSFFIKPDVYSVAPGTSLKEHEATDIDGFEFTRRFQFEDNGDIPIEIDFPPLIKSDVYFLRIVHPNGFYGATVRKTNPQSPMPRRANNGNTHYK
ncbi:MAG: hypothetical protein NC342_07160 [Pseudoflavonifractor sp.]|nr:hypothetical protein [Alloprevotella sp.]MCM1117297.1 hypothetical protein [Pseudoflavonifractor sp.]